MENIEEENPYNEDESPGLYRAWKEGFIDGLEGKAIEEKKYDSTEKHGVYVDGYRASTIDK